MLSQEKAQREGEQFVFTRIANVFVGDRERERERERDTHWVTEYVIPPPSPRGS